MNINGRLDQDFDIRIEGNLISVLNAPIPAATSSLSISEYIVELLINKISILFLIICHKTSR